MFSIPTSFIAGSCLGLSGAYESASEITNEREENGQIIQERVRLKKNIGYRDSNEVRGLYAIMNNWKKVLVFAGVASSLVYFSTKKISLLQFSSLSHYLRYPLAGLVKITATGIFCYIYGNKVGKNPITATVGDEKLPVVRRDIWI